MPTYTFINKQTGEEKDFIMSMSERDDFVKENTEWEQKLVFPKVVTHVGGVKTDDTWKDTLKAIKSNSAKGNTIKV